jgi:hypothetical protein
MNTGLVTNVQNMKAMKLMKSTSKLREKPIALVRTKTAIGCAMIATIVPTQIIVEGVVV